MKNISCRQVNRIKRLLEIIDIPNEYINKISCLTLLALLQLKKSSPLSDAQKVLMRNVDIMEFVNTYYKDLTPKDKKTGKRGYKPNTRESFRKNATRHFYYCAIVEKEASSTNDGNTSYIITDEFLELVKVFADNNNAANKFNEKYPTLLSRYQEQREKRRIHVNIDGFETTLSPGEHNELQAKIITDFRNEFAKESQVLYFGDTEVKDLYVRKDLLTKLNINIDTHNQLPDIILYNEFKNWIYFIEAVTSTGPISKERMEYIKNDLAANCPAGIIYVTAFPDSNEFKRFYTQIAWHTEVWIAEYPKNMVHLNGDRFLGPR